MGLLSFRPDRLLTAENCNKAIWQKLCHAESEACIVGYAAHCERVQRVTVQEVCVYYKYARSIARYIMFLPVEAWGLEEAGNQATEYSEPDWASYKTHRKQRTV